MGSTVFESVFEFLGDYAKARKWALLGIKLSLSLPEAKYFPVLYRSLHYIIMDRQYPKAVNLFRYLEEKLANIRKASTEGKDIGDYSQVKYLLGVTDSDNFFFAQVIIPVAITVAHDIVRGRLKEEAFSALIENLFNAFQPAIRQSTTLHFLRSLFENILINRIIASSLEAQLNAYTGDYRAPMATAAYALQSVFTDAREAARLQVPIATQLHLFQNLGDAFYHFEIVPFLETFWMAKFSAYRQQVGSWEFWQTKSLPRLQKATLANKVKTTFELVIHHTGVPLTAS